jgi:hypothetical protein
MLNIKSTFIHNLRVQTTLIDTSTRRTRVYSPKLVIVFNLTSV